MRDAEFKAWLEARRWKGVPLASTAIRNRRARLKRVERSLRAMGFADNDLDRLIERGSLPALVDRLRGYIGASGGDGPPLSLVPQATNPDGQLTNLLAVTRLYGRFAAGEDPNAHEPEPDEAGDDQAQIEKDADNIRAAALKLYIKPARAQGQPTVSIRAGDLHRTLGLHNAHANVCQALGGDTFQALARVPAPEVTGPPASSTTTFRFALTPKSAGSRPLTTSAPTNRIFYGPPGTGKTYRTAREAVRLCDGEAPADRPALMARYRELCREGRIEFVTFHQSFSYEEFVEGLRPSTSAEAGGSAGFELKPRNGVFLEIADLADQARRAAAEPQGHPPIDLSRRRFWKMGLGAIGLEDHVYEGAIDGGYVVLGWGGEVDWSDPAYEDINAVRARWAQVAPPDSKPSNVSQLHPFRAEMKKGDIIIVPYGNTAFRAIAEVTGDYVYAPTAEGGYNHRREVKWLLVLDRPLSLDSIVEGDFTMRTLYPLNPSRIRFEAVSRLLGGGADGEAGAPGVAPSFVLIIDEINRANISKVFGELITLIEADKRLGMVDELRVKLPYSNRLFGVPPNLHLIGTMNTADRSIALLDTALRRRFAFEELMPQPELLDPAAKRTGVDLVSVLRTINERIEYLFDREHQIGHALFMGCHDRDDVDDVMRDRVIPLLQEYFFEDWTRLALVLGERKGVRDGAFLRCEPIPCPPELDGEPQWRWSVKRPFAKDAYDRLLAKGASPSAAGETLIDAADPAAAE